MTPEFAAVTLLGATPPKPENPHATTLPSVFSAAKVQKVEYTATTPVLTLPGVVPPESPHATTLPSVFSAAKALWVEYTAMTPELTVPGFVPPLTEFPHATMLPVANPFVEYSRISVGYKNKIPRYSSIASVKYIFFKLTPVCDSKNQFPPSVAAPVSSVDARTVTSLPPLIICAVSVSIIYFQSGLEYNAHAIISK
jgi:hypothetical protein